MKYKYNGHQINFYFFTFFFFFLIKIRSQQRCVVRKSSFNELENGAGAPSGGGYWYYMCKFTPAAAVKIADRG